MDAKHILDRIVRGDAPIVELWPVAENRAWSEHLDFYDLLAGELAKQYWAGSYSFEQADAAANALWVDMIERSAARSELLSFPARERQGVVISELMHDVYDAFDAGESSLVDDPVTRFTDPAIRAIVDGL